MENKLLFSTTHGSRLYNIHHDDSDWDRWEVYSNSIPSPSKSIEQKITGKDDVVRMNLSTFMNYAYRSSHQVLECMFSEQAEVDLIRDLRLRYFLNTGTFVSLYRRTIRDFVYRDDLKSVRHAARMSFNLQDGLKYGRFNPTATEERREFLLNAHVDDLRAQAESVVPLEVPTLEELILMHGNASFYL